jgi:hypothetical protein
VNPQGEGGGKREGTETHPIAALAGLEAVGTGAAGGRQKEQRHGGAGNWIAAWEGYNGVGKRLL